MTGSVGAIGAGIGGAGAIGAAAPGAAAGVGAAHLGGTSALAGAGMQQLVSALRGYSTAEIMLALMLIGGNQDDKKSPDLAMALLAGMALGGQLGGFSSSAGSIPAIGNGDVSGACGSVGLQINFQA